MDQNDAELNVQNLLNERFRSRKWHTEVARHLPQLLKSDWRGADARRSKWSKTENFQVGVKLLYELNFTFLWLKPLIYYELIDKSKTGVFIIFALVNRPVNKNPCYACENTNYFNCYCDRNLNPALFWLQGEQCVLRSNLCDGKIDCVNGRDEHNCWCRENPEKCHNCKMDLSCKALQPSKGDICDYLPFAGTGFTGCYNSTMVLEK